MLRILFALVLFLAINVLPSSGQTTERPNVVLVVIDDLNDWIGCLDGHPQAKTPHLDRLAGRGVLFTNAHCVASACNPSRAAMFSGRKPSVTGVWSNDSGSIDRRYPQADLLPSAFRRAGYRTLGTGKLLHARAGKRAFDQFYEVEQRWSPLTKQTVAYRADELPSKATDQPRHLVDALDRQFVLPLNRMPSDRRPDRSAGESFDWGPFDVPDTAFGDTQITDWAIEELGKPRPTPLFLAVGYYRPHIPLWAPQRFFDRFRNEPASLPEVRSDDLVDLTPVARRWATAPITAGAHQTVVKFDQWRQAVEAYLACVTYIDHEVGRLVAALERRPSGDNTWIVVCSDHGWHLGEKQHWGKWTGWERATRVPLMIVPPRRIAKSFADGGVRCDEPVSLLDLYPTLSELCGLSSKEPLDGVSLVPLLREPRQWTGRAVSTSFDAGNATLRTKRWRYIRYEDGSEELYDHRQDPKEWHNLANNPMHAKRLETLREELALH